ncbi:MAG: HdeD family acid-resistance protein [Aminipila sp.]
MRILTISSGVLLILTGLWCFINQGVAFDGLAFIVGLVMIINGIIGTAAYIKKKNRLEKMMWILSESILSVILGGIVLSNQLATDLIIIMFFGMWLLISGCNRVVGALTLKKEEDSAWTWLMGLGAICVVAGVYYFFNSALAGLVVGVLVGISFLIQGANILTMGITMPHVKRRRHYRTKD